MKNITTLAVALALATGATAASAEGLDALKKAAGGLDVGSLVSGNAGNVAGIVEFCIKNKYLGGEDAGSIKDKLSSKFSLGALGGSAAASDAAEAAAPDVSLEDSAKAALSGALGGESADQAAEAAAGTADAAPTAAGDEAPAVGDAVAAEPSEADKAGYLDGLKGLLKTKDGKSLDLADQSGGLKSKITEKACDAILDQAKSLL